MKIKDKFTQLKKEGRKAFIAYVPFGFPKIEYTKDIILSLQAAGADVIEVGIPFSDPLADGPLIQRATAAALEQGVTVDDFFAAIKEIKGKIKIPIAVMTYVNPFFNYGMDKFFQQMSSNDISGIMAVDLPLEESREYIKKSKQFDLETVFFITPTTSDDRAKAIVKSSRGFIYYVSVTGTTGPQDLSYRFIATHVRRLRKITNLPICIGFGIHQKKQVEEIGKFSDGVIVGSAIVRFIGDNFRKHNFLNNLQTYVKSLLPVCR